MEPASVRMDDPIAHSAHVGQQARDSEGNQTSVRRPERHSHNRIRVLLEGDLAGLTALQGHYPEIGMASAVGKIHKIAIGWVQAGSVNLPGLMCNTHPSAYILCGASVHRKLPDVELHAFAADHDAAITIHIRAFVPGFAKRQLLRLAPGF